MKLINILLLIFILSSNAYAYKDMSKVKQRAKDLNMRTQDYTFAMAFSGIVTGAMFGIFLWKVK